jgi:hypothetical protein
MLGARNRKVKEGEKAHAFQKSLLQLYQKFEVDVEALCKKHEVQISCWYSPSAIPQPKFIVDGVTLDADDLYEQKEPSKLIKQHT